MIHIPPAFTDRAAFIIYLLQLNSPAILILQAKHREFDITVMNIRVCIRHIRSPDIDTGNLITTTTEPAPLIRAWGLIMLSTPMTRNDLAQYLPRGGADSKAISQFIRDQKRAGRLIERAVYVEPTKSLKRKRVFHFVATNLELFT